MNQFFTNKDEIIDWLNAHNIKNYTVRDNLIVDVASHVIIHDKALEFLPVQFGTIDYSFQVSYNSLKSLKGSPSIIKGTFECSGNNLTSLKYSPQETGSSFVCVGNDLISLEGCPKRIEGNFQINDNPLSKENILNLDLWPDYIGGNVVFGLNNPILEPYWDLSGKDFKYLKEVLIAMRDKENLEKSIDNHNYSHNHCNETNTNNNSPRNTSGSIKI